MTEDLLPGPLVTAERITTLTGPPGLELMALTAAIAVSIKTGREIIPGWCPAWPGEVTVFCYQGTWVDWRSMVQDIADDAQIAAPMIDFQFLSDPLAQKEVDSNPYEAAYWGPYREADAAAAADSSPSNRLFIVFGLGGVMAHGTDGLMLQLYRFLEGITTLMVGSATAFHEDNWRGVGEQCAVDFGPVFSLPSLRDSTPGVSDLLSRLAAARLDEDRLESCLAAADRPLPTSAHAESSRRRAATAEAFFATEPAEVLHAILSDGRSAESRRVKAKARTRGITPRTLWKAAKRLEAAFGQRGSDSRIGTPLLETTDRGPGLLHGYLAVYDEWAEVDGSSVGNFMQKLAPGCFTRTIAESRNRMKVDFQHGRNPQLGEKPLGPLADLVEDERGVHYTVPLYDTQDNRRLALGLAAGLYRSSYRLTVMAEDFNKKPGRSAWNPRGLPERTILEARLPNFGPVASPLYPSTSAGLREPHVEEGQ